jgi:hypothetical protein
MPTNRRLADFDGPDYYPTPRWATEALLYYETFPGILIEPCAGEHDLSDVLVRHGYKPVTSDIIDYNFRDPICHFNDILDAVDCAVTNPPFKLAEELIHHLMKICTNKFALLLRLSFLESVGRYERIYNNTPPARVYVFSERLSMYPKGDRGELAGGTTAMAWFIWERNIIDWYCAIQPRRPEIRWIKPGFKNAFN